VLLYHLSSHSALPYWINKGHLTNSIALLIDWPLLHEARPPTYQMWASEFASGHSTVGSTMYKWKKWDLSLCPFCWHTEEMTLHVLQCPDPAWTVVWHQSIDSLHTWLQQSDTLPAITRWFCTTLHMRGLHPAPLSPCSPLHQASTAQHSIGFFNLLLSCLTPQWEVLQQQHWLTLGITRSPCYWARGICLQLLQVTHTLWTSRNQQLQELQHSLQSQSIQDAIRSEFKLGISHLLPCDHFYITQISRSEGFSLDYVLSLPLADQQLWLHALQSARTHGSHISSSEIHQMQSHFCNWLQLPSSVPPNHSN